MNNAERKGRERIWNTARWRHIYVYLSEVAQPFAAKSERFEIFGFHTVESFGTLWIDYSSMMLVEFLWQCVTLYR